MIVSKVFDWEPTPLRWYQIDAIKNIRFKFIYDRAHLLADDMGLGKTVQALGILHSICRRSRRDKALIIVRSFLLPEWEKEIDKWLDKNLYDITLISYSNAVKNRKEIVKSNYEILILDEAHCLKDFKSQRTQAILGSPYTKNIVPIIKRCKKILSLTGTPCPNRVGEIYPFLWAIKHPSIKNMTYEQFIYKYASYVKQTRFGIIHKGLKNEDTLKQILEDTMTRRLIREVEKELPEAIEINTDLEINSTLLSEENYLLKEISELAGYSKKEFTHFKENPELLIKLLNHKPSFEKLSTLRKAQAIFKIPLVLSYLKDKILETNQKFILVCYHISVAYKYYTEIEKLAKCPISLVTGEISGEERYQILKQADKDTKHIVIVTMSAIAEGLTLTGFNYMFFTELHWSPGILNQVKRRIYRIGQTKKVFWYSFILNSGVEKLIYNTVYKKTNMIKKLFRL